MSAASKTNKIPNAPKNFGGLGKNSIYDAGKNEASLFNDKNTLLEKSNAGGGEDETKSVRS